MPDTRRPRVELLEDRLAPAAAGSFDPTFGTNGVVNITSGGVYRLASTPDGDFLALSGTPRFVSGLTQPGFSGPFSLALFGPNGMPDPAFGTGGAVTIPGSTGVPILTALPDGGALVGWNEPDAARGTTDFDLARVTAAGAIDTTFGSGGTAVVPTPGGSSTADLAAVVLQPDGQILLGGDQIQALNDGSGQTPAGQLLVVRVSAAGQPDPTFGAGGTAVVPFPVGSSNYATGGGLAVQPDGRIVLAGSALVSAQTQSTPVAVRLTAAGQPDPTFGSGGRVQVTFPQQYTGNFQTVGIQADGRVVLAGLVVTNPTSTGFPLPAADGAARLTADGQLDPTYGTGGVSVGGEITTVLDSGTNGVILNAAIDSSGRVVFDAAIYNDIRIRGFVDSATVSRLTADGATDGGFGTNGTVTFDSLGRTTPPLIWMPGLTLQSNGNILLSGTAQEAGPFRMVQLIGSNPPSGFVAATTGTLVAGGPADGTIQVLNPTSGTYSLAGTVTAFPGFAGNVRVATADVNGDGIPDYIFGAGPGGAPEVTVYDGQTGTTLADFPAFESTFTGGVFVAAADLDGDGKAEVIVTPDQGGGPRVVVFAIQPGGAAVLRASFLGIDDPNFRGGARIAAGDVNHDGHPDLVVAAGFEGGPRVAVFSGATVFSGTPARLVNDFYAFPGADAAGLRDGTYVAVGDVNGDGFADLIFGGGPGGAPRVLVLSGAVVAGGNVDGAEAAPLGNFYVAGAASDRGGVRVAAVAGGNGTVSVAAGSGAGDPAHIRVYPGSGFTGGGEPGGFQDITPFGGTVLPDGVYVG